jgi:nucleoside-diphosphate-sugar epimerase
MTHLLIFGLGYTAAHLSRRLTARGWDVTGTSRDGRDGTVRFDDRAAVLAALRDASHVLSSVPPGADDRDPVLDAYGEALALAPLDWVGYLSSTGVYGDAAGAWVDESAPIRGRRAGRNAADAAWLALRADIRVFRLPGIYGPGRSALDRVREGKAHRVDLPDQVFSRIHVDDIAAAIIASFTSPTTGAFNIADDLPCSQNDVIEAAAAMLGLPSPPLIAPDDPALSPMARSFYAENRRVANGRAKRLLGWAPRYPDYRSGLAACIEHG